MLLTANKEKKQGKKTVPGLLEPLKIPETTSEKKRDKKTANNERAVMLTVPVGRVRTLRRLTQR